MEKLYAVSFGSRYSDAVYVLAEGWEEAIKKAEAYQKHKRETASIFGEDNSLRTDVEPKVRNVELISDEVVR